MKSATCRGLVIRRVGKSTSGGQRKSKCVAKLEKIPLFGVKVCIKKKRPGTDFVSIPGSFMGIDPNFNRIPFLGCIPPFGWGAFCVLGCKWGAIIGAD